MLPNVYPELETLSHNGRPLTVKNTFVDIEEEVDVEPNNWTSLPWNFGSPKGPRHSGDANSAAIGALPHVKEGELDCVAPPGLEQPGERKAAESGELPPGATTFMIRGLPAAMDRAALEATLNAEGFFAAYDFIYLPTDLKDGGCFGYGFINLVSDMEAQRFKRHFHGFSWGKPDQENMGVHMSEGLQGLDKLVERYRNSPLMHRSVPPGARPAVYSKGELATFPAPTERLKKPRVRHSQGEKPAQEGS